MSMVKFEDIQDKIIEIRGERCLSIKMSPQGVVI